jgi:hypothetical protein
MSDTGSNDRSARIHDEARLKAATFWFVRPGVIARAGYPQLSRAAEKLCAELLKPGELALRHLPGQRGSKMPPAREVVFDPAIPERARRHFARAAAFELVELGGYPAPPSAGPAAPFGPSAPPRVPSGIALKAGYSAAGMVVLAMAAGLTFWFASALMNAHQGSTDVMQAAYIPFFVFLGLAAAEGLGTVAYAIGAWITGWSALEGAVSMGPFQRRYVIVAKDLDPDVRLAWERVAAAQDRLFRSEVVIRQLVETEEVSKALPYHLWDIARGLAGLSALRAQHREILRGVDAAHPDVAEILDPQRCAQERRAAEVWQRIQSVEVFADLVEKADAARQREEAVTRLAALNDPHADLLAQQDHGGNELGSAGQVSQDVQAVIQQANDAIRKANEAGRNLALPDGTL